MSGCCATAPVDLVKPSGESQCRVDLSTFLGGDTVMQYRVPARIRRRGVEMRIVIDGAERGSSQRKPDPALIKAMVRARGWWNELVAGSARSYGEIAKRESVTKRYVGHLIPLAFLAPEIVQNILMGNHPIDLTTETLTKRTELPRAWAEQKIALGME